MSKLNWGVIQNGGTFESLMHAIVFANDPSAILFGRPGKDSGQDAKSGDGLTVYQAKYSQSMTMGGAINLAKTELKKIQKYRQANHSNFTHWNFVTHWVMFANLQKNPNDENKWMSEVVPLFQKEGLIAECRSIEYLDQELIKHSHIMDVFFGGKNRVLISLKEAYQLLEDEMIGAESLQKPFIGHQDAIKTIKAFADSDDKSILPIVGPGGIGKSRLAFETLLQLSDTGWRCHWGLPGSMEKSSDWFRLLNGKQKTVVVLDNPDSSSLVRMVVEQFASTERMSWKIILLCRPEKKEIYNQYKASKNFHPTIELDQLGEFESHELLISILGETDLAWLNQAYHFTRGNPGWLCLIGTMNANGLLHEIPSSTEEIAKLYVDSCIENIPEAHKENARDLLCWLCLWGVLRLPPTGQQSSEMKLLESKGISSDILRNLLQKLIDSKVVANWGVDKSAFAVEPLIIRQQILSQWLLQDQGEKKEVSNEGKSIVDQLLNGAIPAMESVLHTLTQLVCTRLDSSSTYRFLNPLFKMLYQSALNDDLKTQRKVLELVEKLGIADPESALDVLSAIRENETSEYTVNDPFWGKQTISHDTLLAKIPWLLYQFSQQIDDVVVATRYLQEFKEYISNEETHLFDSDSGKSPKQLLKRLLCESRNAEIFAIPAKDIVIKDLDDEACWPFVGQLAKCLLNPIREISGWSAKYTVYFQRFPIEPNTANWNIMQSIRHKVFEILPKTQEKALFNRLWRIAAHAHNECHQATSHLKMSPSTLKEYRTVIRKNLETVLQILRDQSELMGVDSATHARDFWEWYLEYGKESDPVDLAKKCEEVYSSINKWRLQDFFKFETSDNLTGETKRIADQLKAAKDADEIQFFFESAREFLDAARDGKRDLADHWRIAELANECNDFFHLDDESPNSITQYALGILQQEDQSNPLSTYFAVCLCKRLLLKVKAQDPDNFELSLRKVLSYSVTPHELFSRIYSNPHPNTNGSLNVAELDLAISFRGELSPDSWLGLLGSFHIVDQTKVISLVHNHLKSIEDIDKRSNAFRLFFQNVRLSLLRYSLITSKELVKWFMDMIIELNLDGSLLGSSDFEWMREQCEFKMNTQMFLELIKSRIYLEQFPQRSRGFSILPSGFRVSEWCEIDFASSNEVETFQELCTLSLEDYFSTSYWMPKYLAELDPSGTHIAEFVRSKLAGNTEITLNVLASLASGFPDTSNQWALIAEPICEKATTLRRDDRAKVYLRLSNKETDVITSMPDEIAPYYSNRLSETIEIRNSLPSDSPLIGYWNWAKVRASDDMNLAIARNEEDDHA